MNKVIVGQLIGIVFYMIPFMPLGAQEPIFLPETEQSYFSNQEMRLLEDTIEVLDFEIDYDYSLELYYLTSADSSHKEIISRRSQVLLVLQKREIALIKSLYEKLYKQYQRIEQEKAKAESDSDSKELTNYLSPLKEYLALLEEHILSRDPAMKSVLNENKKRIAASVNKQYERAEDSPISFFTRKELTILENTTQTLDLDYGYDEEINLAYIYSFSYSESNLKQKERFFTEILTKLKANSLFDFYKKIYRLYAMTIHKMELYKENRNWKYYIFIKNELLPSLQFYFNLLEQNVQKIEPSLNPAIEKFKKDADQWVQWYYRDKERIVDTF